MKKIFIFLIVVFATFTVKAQIWTEYSSFYPSVGVQVGTRGIGIEGGYPIADAFNVRASASIFPLGKLNVGKRVFELSRSDVSLFVDWQPLLGRRSWIARKWIVSLGAGYFFENKYEKYQWAAVKEDRLKDYGVEWSQFRPYVGTGLNGIRLAERFNLAVNVGYYIPTSSNALKVYEMDPVDIPRQLDRWDKFPRNVLPGINAQVGISYIFFKNSYKY